MPIKALLFDLDGTLLDTHQDFVAVLNRLLADEKKAPLPAARIRATVSNGARALIKLGFNLEENHSNFDPLRARLLAYYEQHLAVFTEPFPGIDALLQRCHAQQLRWGIVTNKPYRYTQLLVEQMNLQPPPDSIVCPDHVATPKPSPESLYLACEQLGCNYNEAIYIGDHQRDIACGKRAGMTTIAAAYGYLTQPSEALTWAADYVVNAVDEIWPIVEHHLGV